MGAARKHKKNPPAMWENVLSNWAAHVPKDMLDETPKDKLLDSFLRLFESLTANGITQVPPFQTLFPTLQRAIRWQWIALNISAPPILAAAAPHVLTLTALRWLRQWAIGQKIANPQANVRLMAAMDRDIGRLNAAMHQILHLRNE